MRVDREVFAPGETTIHHVDLRNTGDRAGDEIAQLYVHDKLSRSVTRPVKLLKGFEHVHLKPGEIRTLNFLIGPNQLPFLDEHTQLTIEPGEFELIVGVSSETTNKFSIRISHEETR